MPVTNAPKGTLLCRATGTIISDIGRNIKSWSERRSAIHGTTFANVQIMHSAPYKHLTNKGLKFTGLVFTLQEDSEIHDTYDNVLEQLMNEHFGINNIPNHVHEYVPDLDNVDEADFIPFTRRELKYTVRMQHVNKAPGFDELDPLVVRNLCGTHGDLMLDLYNKCFRLGYFPEYWKRGKVVFFRKRNKNPCQPVLSPYNPAPCHGEDIREAA